MAGNLSTTVSFAEDTRSPKATRRLRLCSTPKSDSDSDESLEFRGSHGLSGSAFSTRVDFETELKAKDIEIQELHVSELFFLSFCSIFCSNFHYYF